MTRGRQPLVGAWERRVRWQQLLPLVGLVVLGATWLVPMTGSFAALCAVALLGAVVSSVHHAEVVAQRVGEPFGTLVLALAVTGIEAGLLVSLIFAAGEGRELLARDTLYATVMIIGSGVLGLCVLLGAVRHHQQSFHVEGASPAFSALAALAVLVLIMPGFTVSAPGALYTTAQLVFVAICSISLWCVFVFFQTIRHRDYFLPQGGGNVPEHAPPPTTAVAVRSFALLLVSLVAVIGLAKAISPAIEAAVLAFGVPRAAIGIAVALIVLLPESAAAIRAALANRLQTSLNLALGSALATIGLTVPIVVGICIAFDLPLVLGLEPKDIVLLTLTLIVGTTGVVAGRANLMHGAVQIVIFAAFLFLALVP
jgi:Ca2+:H+ antiporter